MHHVDQDNVYPVESIRRVMPK